MHIQLKLDKEMIEIFKGIMVDKGDDLPDDEELVNDVVEHLKKGFDKEKMTFDEKNTLTEKLRGIFHWNFLELCHT
ncbi:hypothetical protein [Methanotorris formicicus]|uniref:Uncharacterized protein n=1 Tax=Methanotorris formicicus Mc-S-70 TaxID=647171 RepID=H1L1S1_9EURY|nr:hypothetical protein [Methanotorris formicicus]EHP83205.1 hypothetical protein MetfoDRAFT_1995 [Methanotorris formicicus Mc-S-70]